MDSFVSLLTEQDWQQAIPSGKGMIKQGEMLILQGQMLIKIAEEKLAELGK